MDTNINTLMRNPEWNKGKRACTIAINPDDAGTLGLTDGQSVRVVTEAGSAVGELQVKHPGPIRNRSDSPWIRPDL